MNQDTVDVTKMKKMIKSFKHKRTRLLMRRKIAAKFRFKEQVAKFDYDINTFSKIIGVVEDCIREATEKR